MISKVIPWLYALATFTLLAQAIPERCRLLVQTAGTALSWREITSEEFTHLQIYASVQADPNARGLVDLVPFVTPGKKGHVVEIDDPEAIGQILDAMSDESLREHQRSKQGSQEYRRFAEQQQKLLHERPQDYMKLVRQRYPGLAALGIVGAWGGLGVWVGYACGITNFTQTLGVSAMGAAAALYSAACVHARFWREYQARLPKNDGPLPFVANPANDLRLRLSWRKDEAVDEGIVSLLGKTLVIAELTADASRATLKLYAFEN